MNGWPLLYVMTPSPAHAPPAKATLYCPECGHASHVDGDWTVRARDDVRTYTCPDCGTTIDTRPTRPESAPERGGLAPVVTDD